MQIRNFSKIQSKISKNIFLKISPYFLVEDAKTFYLICESLFYC